MGNNVTDPEHLDFPLDFLAQYPAITYADGDVIVYEGETPEHIYYIMSGRVKIMDYTPSGTALTLNVFASHGLVSLSWLFEQKPSRYFYTACGDTYVRSIPVTDVLQFIENNPAYSLAILKRLTRGLDGYMSRLSLHLTSRSSKRLGLEILIEAERFGVQHLEGIRIESSISDLASQSGLTRETTSRQLKKLVLHGLVKKQKRLLFVPDLSLLKEYINT